MFVTNWISTTKIQKISEITNFFRHYFLSRTEVLNNHLTHYKAFVRSSSKSYSITQLLNYSVLFCPYVSSCIDSILYIYIYKYII